MTDSLSQPRQAFPWWVVGGAFVLAAAYLPSLATPFDFLDDGNLVYPTVGFSFVGHVEIWWDKVVKNVAHLGPFRPTLWVHWEIFANLFGADPFLWRLHRLLWCALSAGLFLWFLRDLKVHPIAALMAGAVGMWNPYRNEIWLSLTLAEGVAMPYAIFALIAARKAARSQKPWRWELASALCVLVALGCKNTFAALVPAQVILRMWPDELSLREAWKRNGRRSLLLAITLLMPIAHFIYFKLNWRPGQYHTTGFTWSQTVRMFAAVKGAIAIDYLAAGLVLAFVAIRMARWNTPTTQEGETFPNIRPAVTAGVLLFLGGFAAYLPVDIISGRYTMPAAWGLDILIGALLTQLVAVPRTFVSRAAWICVAAGIAAVMVSLIGKQEKFAARAKVLWDAVHYVERTAPPGAGVAWVGGDYLKGELDTEEGIHFRWHLLHRGRGDVRVGLFDAAGKIVPRVELPPFVGEPQFRIAVSPSPREWSPEQNFDRAFWMGRRHFAFQLERRAPTFATGHANAMLTDAFTQEMLGELPTPTELKVDGPDTLEAYFTTPK